MCLEGVIWLHIIENPNTCTKQDKLLFLTLNRGLDSRERKYKTGMTAPELSIT